jgi:hypothetical protein
VAIWVREAEFRKKFFYEFSNLNTACFERFLDIFLENYPDDLQ